MGVGRRCGIRDWDRRPCSLDSTDLLAIDGGERPLPLEAFFDPAVDGDERGEHDSSQTGYREQDWPERTIGPAERDRQRHGATNEERQTGTREQERTAGFRVCLTEKGCLAVSITLLDGHGWELYHPA
jgi:hypothetical protein